MVRVLAAPALYVHTGGEPPTQDDLERRYEVQSAGHSPDGTQGWLNWVARSRTGRAAGYVQATLTGAEHAMRADVAWVVGVEHQGNGLATEAAGAMMAWLAQHGVVDVRAFIAPDNLGSNAVARKLGLVPTDIVVDAEVCWSARARGPG